MAADPRSLADFRGALDVTLDLPLAGVGSRAIAHLFDNLILMVLAMVAVAAISLANVLVTDLPGWVWAATAFASFLAQWFWFAAWEARTGQTPGKKLLGLRVVSRNGAAPDTLAAMIRNLLRVADFLPGFYFAGLASCLLSSRCQRLGDLAAGTVVVTERVRTDHGIRWPDGFDARDVALVEAWYAREAGLVDDQRTLLAARMLSWLAQDHPQLLTGAPKLPEPELVDWIFRRSD